MKVCQDSLDELRRYTQLPEKQKSEAALSSSTCSNVKGKRFDPNHDPNRVVIGSPYPPAPKHSVESSRRSAEAQFSLDSFAFDYSPVRRYSVRQRKRVFKFPYRDRWL